MYVLAWSKEGSLQIEIYQISYKVSYKPQFGVTCNLLVYIHYMNTVLQTTAVVIAAALV